MKLYVNKKQKAAGVFAARSLGEMQGTKPQPWLKHECKRSHLWVRSKYSQRCSRCGKEELRNVV